MIRQATKPDLEYILSSWQLTYEESPEMNMPGLIRDEYFRHTHLILDELIARASECGSMYICHEPGAPYLIRGYLCGEVVRDPHVPQIEIAYVHWVQVKKKDWGNKLFSRMMDQYIKDFDIKPEQNILYTFSSKKFKRDQDFAKHVQQKYRLVYWPWWKYTSQPRGWETGVL